MAFIMELIQQKDGEKKKRWLTRKKAIILGLVAFVCIGSGVAVCFAAYNSRNQTFLIKPDFGHGDLINIEDADWFTEISGTVGPFEKQSIRVCFGHGTYFKWEVEYETIIANERQKTVLALNREVFFRYEDGDYGCETRVIYEDHSTFKKHLIADDFLFDRENLFVIDKIASDDLPKTFFNGRGDNFIRYRVSVKAEEDDRLDYRYSNPGNVPCVSIFSHWSTQVGYSISSSGIRFFRTD